MTTIKTNSIRKACSKLFSCKLRAYSIMSICRKIFNNFINNIPAMWIIICIMLCCKFNVNFQNVKLPCINVKHWTVSGEGSVPLSQESILEWARIPFLGLIKRSCHGWLSMMTSSEGLFQPYLGPPILSPPLSIMIVICIWHTPSLV